MQPTFRTCSIRFIRKPRRIGEVFAGVATNGRFFMFLSARLLLLQMIVSSALGGEQAVSPAGSVEALSEATIRRMVVRLGSPRLVERETAEQVLLDLGPGVLSRLPAEREVVSAEIRARLEEIRKTLQTAAARDALAPSRFSISRIRMPLDLLMAELEEELTPIELAPALEETPPVVSLPEEAFTFWELLDRVAGEHRLRLATEETDGKLRLEPFGPGRLPLRHVEGPLLFSSEGLQEREMPAEDSGGVIFATDLRILWEPRLAPIRISVLPESLVGRDSAGRTILESFSTAARWEAPVARNNLLRSFRLTLRPLAEESVKATCSTMPFLPRLEGIAELLLPTEKRTFVFPDCRRGVPQSQQYGEVRLDLLETFPAEGGEAVGLRLRVAFENPGDALESYRSWIFQNHAALLFSSGERVLPKRIRPREQGRGHVVIDLLFPKSAFPEKAVSSEEPVSFLYVTPTVLIEKTYPFRFDRLAIDR